MAADDDPRREARRRLIERTVAGRGIRDPRVLAAMLEVPRHRFLPPEAALDADLDAAIPIGHGATISQPYVVALMTELAELQPEHRVLEIGTGSGYQAAILARLARRVHSIERIPELAERARRTLLELGVDNVEIRVGDGSEGWREIAPFDSIVVTAAGPEVPLPLLDQIADGGRLVMPVGDRGGQRLVRVVRSGGSLRFEDHGGVVFVPLVGRHGWRDER